jgi:hypothetical protein
MDGVLGASRFRLVDRDGIIGLLLLAQHVLDLGNVVLLEGWLKMVVKLS